MKRFQVTARKVFDDGTKLFVAQVSTLKGVEFRAYAKQGGVALYKAFHGEWPNRDAARRARYLYERMKAAYKEKPMSLSELEAMMGEEVMPDGWRW